MAVIIQGGTGSGFRAAVTEENRLKVDSIISGSQEVSVSGTFNVTANTGSQSYLFGKSGADYYSLLSTSGADGGLLRIDGNFSATVGSESYIPAGSIIVTNVVNVLGSVYQTNSPSVTTGSESWIKGGSLAPYSGTNYIDVTQTTSPWVILGSVNVDNSADIGSIDTQKVSGSVFATGSINISTSPVIVLGSVNIDNSSDVGGYAGSDIYMPGGSVVVENIVSVIGSTHVTQSTSPWIISGEVTTNNYLGSNAYIPAGSVIVTNSPSVDIGNIGSVRAILDNPVSVGSYTTQGVTFSSGTGYIDVIQTTDPWIVLGSVNTVVDNFVAVGSFTTQTIDGTIVVTDISSAGSLATQNINGSVSITEQVPTDTTKINFATTLLYSGTLIGSLVKTNPAGGSFVQVLVYDASDNIINVGSWI